MKITDYASLVLQKNKTGLFIPARTRSNRFYGKLTSMIYRKTMLERCIISILPIKHLFDHIVILGDNSDSGYGDARGSFDFIKDIFPFVEIRYYWTKDNDTLGRFYEAIKEFEVTYVVRLCADRIINDNKIQKFMLNYLKENKDLNYISCEKNPLRSVTGEVYRAIALEELYDRHRLYQLLENNEDSYIWDGNIRDILEHISVAFRNKVKIETDLKKVYPYDFSIDTKEELKIHSAIVKRFYESGLIPKEKKKDPMSHCLDPLVYMQYYKEFFDFLNKD